MAIELPDNDKDLILARKVGRALEEGEHPESVDDPLIRELSIYSRQRKHALASEEVNSETLWNRIDRNLTDSSSESSASVIPSFNSNAVRWAAAAVVLIAALVYFQYLQGPSLIAESGTAIETVKLDDGSTVTMRPHSQLYSISETEELSSYRLEGEAYFEVIPSSSRTFEVEAGRGLVRVLGTKFTLSSWGNATQVFLEEGSVEFRGPAAADPVLLEPGQSSILTEDREQPVLTEITGEEFTDWLNNELVFNNRPAFRVFNEVEQHFGITINAPEKIQSTTLSGSLSLEDREATLSDLALSLGGTFNRTGEESYTFTTQ